MLQPASTRRLARAGALLVAVVAFASPASAWFTVGHAKVARAAVRALPPTVPRFFRDGAFRVGEAAVDPDLFKDPNLVALRAAEDPQHYLDWELIAGMPLPADRWAFIAQLADRKVAPNNVGILPYSLLESVQRLTMTFAEYRHYPDDAAIQQKALVYAGWLAHYAGDLEQPLHTTIHHDGRALPDGSTPKTGIHQLVDGLFERVPFDEAKATQNLPIQVYPDVWAAIQAELARSHALVDRVYTLEPALRRAFPPPPPTPTPRRSLPGTRSLVPNPRPRTTAPMPAPAVPASVTVFTAERYRATASFLASLYRTAWEQSAAIQLPNWLERPQPMP
ncbi:MAG TPA: hypothetical protein VGS57_05680 [Thermoanaerobaculia bacterium]|jgi:hypothetical protein|nr:hypothetical protein [Thermoanaerobaculia bacterium]